MRFISSLNGNYCRSRTKKVLLLAILVLLTFFALIMLLDQESYVAEEIVASSPRWDIVQECLPKQRVMLLKTHKCASSAVQNILLRYGHQNNLTFALPYRGNYLGHPQKFQVKTIGARLLPQSGKVDVFCLHSRLNEGEMKKVLHPETVWVTLVRDPTHLFESLFTYSNLKQYYHVALDDFGTKISLESLRKMSRTKGIKVGKNQMLFDLGGEENLPLGEVSALIEEIDRLFDLVIITERMEESLVLLRHRMCWSLKDVVVFQRNARADNRIKHIGQVAKETIRNLNAADALIYDHFLARHEDEVRKFGEQRMQREVLELKALTKVYYEYCVKAEVSGHDPRLKFKEYSGLVGSYLLNDNRGENCRLLTIPELDFINLIREKQENYLHKKP